MRRELREVIWQNWCQPVTSTQGRKLTFAADIQRLDRASLDELRAIYVTALPHRAGFTPEYPELARLLHALMLIEYRLHGVELLPPELRWAAWRSAATEVGWPLDRLSSVADRWRISGRGETDRVA